MAAMAACKNSAGLLAARFFLGVTEAGLFPGVIFYLTLWYTRKEQATRVAFFFATSTLAGVSINIYLFRFKKIILNYDFLILGIRWCFGKIIQKYIFFHIRDLKLNNFFFLIRAMVLCKWMVFLV
jgi:MFS family permease